MNPEYTYNEIPSTQSSDPPDLRLTDANPWPDPGGSLDRAEESTTLGAKLVDRGIAERTAYAWITAWTTRLKCYLVTSGLIWIDPDDPDLTELDECDVTDYISLTWEAVEQTRRRNTGTLGSDELREIAFASRPAGTADTARIVAQLEGGRAIDRVKSRFDAVGHPIDPRTGMAQCPAHDDEEASLSIGVGDDGKVLFRCFARCRTEDILQQVGLSWSDVFENDDRNRSLLSGPRTATQPKSAPPAPGALPATGTDGAQPQTAPKRKQPNRTSTTQPDVWKHYYNADGTYVHSVMKWNPLLPTFPKKEFRQGVCKLQPDGNPIEDRFKLEKWDLDGVERVPYRLPELIEAIKNGRVPVFWVEGEKDVDALRVQNLVATTSSQGANGFKKLVDSGGLEVLRGQEVIVWPDDDEPGHGYGAQIVQCLSAAGAKVVAVVASAHGYKDAADHIDAGKGIVEKDIKYLAMVGGEGDIPDPQEWSKLIVAKSDVAKARQAMVEPVNAEVVDIATRQRPAHAQAFTELADGRRVPQVTINDRPRADIVAHLANVLSEINADTPTVFYCSGRIVEVDSVALLGSETEARIQMVDVTAKRLRAWIGRNIDCRKNLKKSTESVGCPQELAEEVLASGLLRLPTLVGVSDIPPTAIDAEKKTICIAETPGYHAPSKMWWAPTTKYPTVPNDPTVDELVAARDLILDLYCEFEFVDDAARANSIALLLTVIFKSAVGKWSVPMWVTTAPKQGSGKSTASELAQRVISPGRPAVTPWPTSDEEMVKALLGMLREGVPVINFGNANRRLSSAPLAGLVTSGAFRGRVLGVNDTVYLESDTVFALDGNNASIDTDFERRVAWVDIDTRSARPADRKFSRDLNAYVTAHRGEIVAALYTIAVGWVRAGCPADNRDGQTRNAQFVQWNRVIGGLAAFGGLTPVPLLANADKAKSSDTEAEEVATLLYALWDVVGGHAPTAPRPTGAVRWSRHFLWRDIDAILRSQSDPRHDVLMAGVPAYISSDRKWSKLLPYLRKQRNAPIDDPCALRLIEAHRDDGRRTTTYQLVADGEVPTVGEAAPPVVTEDGIVDF